MRHKDSYRHLKFTQVRIPSIDVHEDDIVVHAIMEELPSHSAFVNAIADTIVKKDAVHDNCRHELAYIDLIIRDRAGVLSYDSMELFIGLFLTQVLRNAILASRFQEIYFVTRFEHVDAYVPLKMATTLAKMYSTLDLLQASGYDNRFQTMNDFTRWFAHYLSTITAGEVRLREEQDEVEFMYGGNGFLFQGGFNVAVRERADVGFPRSVVVTTDADWDDFGAYTGVPDYEQNHVFNMGLVFAVRTGEVLASAAEPDDEAPET